MLVSSGGRAGVVSEWRLVSGGGGGRGGAEQEAGPGASGGPGVAAAGEQKDMPGSAPQPRRTSSSFGNSDGLMVRQNLCYYVLLCESADHIASLLVDYTTLVSSSSHDLRGGLVHSICTGRQGIL